MLECCLLVLAFLLAWLLSGWWIHPGWSLVALANFGWLCTLLFRLEPRATVLLLPQLVTVASSMVAMIMIEFGAEMFELGIVGRPGPWSSALNCYNLAFFAGATLVLKQVLRALDSRKEYALSPVLDRFANPLAAIVLGLTAIVALVLIARGLQTGFPLLTGADRFQYRRFAADKVTVYALNFKFVIGYALGMVAFAIPASRWLRIGALAAFSALLVTFFLFGDKFFTQLCAASAFMAPYLYRHHALIVRRIGVYAMAGTLALATVLTVTTYIYSNGFAQSSAATTKRLSGRMVGQGELWFLQSSIGAPLLDWNAGAMGGYAEALTVKAVDLFAIEHSLGANYFSNHYAPDYLRASLHRNAGSVTYTSATEAMGLLLFGWLGLGLMMFALGLLFALACGYIAFAIENRSIPSALFAAYIYTQLRTSIIQASPWVIGSIYSLRWLMIILAIELALLVLGRGRMRPPTRMMAPKASRLSACVRLPPR